MDKDLLNAVEEAIEYMKNHLEADITSEDLAAKYGYSTYHFLRAFKEVTGVTPRHFLSALRIEASKQMLTRPSNSILKSLLSIGYKSIGSYSSRFKQYVGQSPKRFKLEYEFLYQFINLYKDKKSYQMISKTSASITCHIKAPPTFKGLVFVGLFPRPIPDQKPVLGTVLHNEGTCKFDHVPNGTYYILAAAIHWSTNPMDYFILDKALRGIFDQPIEVRKDTIAEVEILLRDPQPFDPPILINLPMLLFDRDKK
ncbi:helix-turn-helix transcriptional regulator [Cytobacillus dafuensis]|uniref:Helix-turn-helix transcriptional regulator n=1 Tax=Cytobacillus dafuensis TaxID=1742359 RepID=A0A5B8YZW7_CYTDA|nr:AraC family transcriptional regulator [Cytobacillus dafuensis]QED46240.1 helix-turn-helix transcriptional regulator [Cytobacillus dafuensis]